MGTPHKHAALIKAWAEGAEIQVRDLTNYSDPNDCKWQDFSKFDYEVWYNKWEYRIKPKTIKYRQNEPRENWLGSIKWLSDWIEVEV